MESNRDDAQKALRVALNSVDSDPAKALRFARKAASLYPSTEAKALVAKLEAGEGSSGKMNGSAGGASTSASTSASEPTLRSRAGSASTSSGSTAPAEGKKFTSKQVDVVKRVRRCQVTEYYEILELKKDCEETHVKSAYRKLALALHPDKNGAPGADEAFKMVSKAFQVLSDPDKRAAYDRHGADPDSRSAGMAPFSRAGGPAFRDDFGGGIDPEEIFRTFFGGPGMQFGGGSPFGGGGGVYTFQFGGPGGGFRTMPRRGGGGGGGGGGANQQVSPWVQLLPLLVLFAISMVSMLPSLFSFGGSSAPDPAFSWSKSQVYPVERTTLGNIGVRYHVNAKQFAQHPMYADFLTSNPSLGFTSPTPSDPKSSSHLSAVQNHLTAVEGPQIRSLAANAASKAQLKIPQAMRRFEQGVENAYLRRLQSECQNGLAVKEERRRRAIGFFGVMADWDEIKRIDAEPVESCTRLRSLGYSTQYF